MSGYNTRLVDRVDLQCTLYFSAAETVSVSHSVSIRSTQRLMPFPCQLKTFIVVTDYPTKVETPSKGIDLLEI